MGQISRGIILPDFEDIIYVNRYHIKNSGGFYTGADNLRYTQSLEWVLEAVRHPLFGRDLYPTLIDKVAKIVEVIIRGHVFFDGNKRTGISILLALMRVNGYDLKATSDELLEVALKVASETEENYSFEQFVVWVRSKAVLKHSVANK